MSATAAGRGEAPGRQGLVLSALILVAAVANLNLAVANVALPDIGAAFVPRRPRSTSSPSATPSASPHQCFTWAPSATGTAAN